MSDNYNLWRIRAESALDGKGYWDQLQSKDCPDDVKKKATAMLVHALSNIALQVCSSFVPDPMKMLNALDERFASTRTSNRISLLTSLYSKRFRSSDNMLEYVDEF